MTTPLPTKEKTPFDEAMEIFRDIIRAPKGDLHKSLMEIRNIFRTEFNQEVQNMLNVKEKYQDLVDAQEDLWKHQNCGAEQVGEMYLEP